MRPSLFLTLTTFISIFNVATGHNRKVMHQSTLDLWANCTAIKSAPPIRSTKKQSAQKPKPNALKSTLVHPSSPAQPQGDVCDFSIKDSQGNTRLHYAAIEGDDVFIQRAAHLKAALDSANFEGKTPFYLALQEEKYSTAKLLLSLGADINKRIGFGYTLLLFALDKRDCAMAKKIMRFGADLSAQTFICHNSALHLAISYDLDAAINALLRAKAPLDLPDHVGQTPIYRAIALGKQKVALQLAQAGASLTHQDNAGLTPITFSREKFYLQLAAALTIIHEKKLSTK